MRVSSREQNEDRQRIALLEMGVPEENIYMDKQSGKNFDRPPKPLPDNFYDVYKAWKNKKMTQKEAVKACNMEETTFYDKVKKFGKD